MIIGLVDLDTSHPAAWVPILKELGHRVAGVIDHGDVHPPGYADRFVVEHDAGTVFASLEKMVDAVDCAVIHGCDWDQHVPRARPFVEAGKAVLIDKPMVGCLQDLNELSRWVEQGKRISGGSSLRFAEEIAQWRQRDVEDRGLAQTVLCGCGVDEFNYGIHAYAMLSAILGPGIKSVQHLGQGMQRRIAVSWDDGRMGLLGVGAVERGLPFYASIVTDRGVESLTVDSSKVYRSLLEAELPYLAGEVEAALVPFDALSEPERCALAAKRSWEEGDRVVGMAELTESGGGYDGKAFAAFYREQKYPQGHTA